MYQSGWHVAPVVSILLILQAALPKTVMVQLLWCFAYVRRSDSPYEGHGAPHSLIKRRYSMVAVSRPVISSHQLMGLVYVLTVQRLPLLNFDHFVQNSTSFAIAFH
ncbi:hypothetical protein BKA67DRAFT_560073 [Truncatella angustata]|uniref:Uncharacterized protein n=1 Tax=Truncatella angustata TaxID=152316 RepID=A0A9P8UN07_9PEZI|nr:uncharacterized protein BKA67DRAFT_560073 [Truncatella angustata]KAH6655261.1 hypothetical protein BKA67DRAFT_560073 [Truncatella angustata]